MCYIVLGEPNDAINSVTTKFLEREKCIDFYYYYCLVHNRCSHCIRKGHLKGNSIYEKQKKVCLVKKIQSCNVFWSRL